MKKAVVLGCLLAACLSGTGETLASPASAWTLQVFLDSSFMLPHATNALKGASIEFDLERYRPRENHDPKAGPVVYLFGAGYSASGFLDVPASGDYVFCCSNAPNDVCAARLAVNGRLVDEFPGGRLSLEKGVARLDVWIKSLSSDEIKARYPAGSPRILVNRHVLWKRADAASFAPVSVTPAPAPDDPAAFDAKLDLAGGRHECWGFRTCDLDVPEDGLYELGLRTVAWRAVSTTMHVDNREVLFRPNRRRHDLRRGFCGDGDQTANRRYIYKPDWFGRAAARRFLAKGRHTVEVRVSPSQPWNDAMPKQASNAYVRVGWRRLPGVNPLSETAFWFADRDSMVFEKGEPLELQAQGAVAGCENEWTLEVWKGEFPTNAATAVPAARLTKRVGTARTTFAYPCAEEGVFEYVIRDRRGRIVEGPWSFIVIDSTPQPPPRSAAFDAATFEKGYGTLVDSVDFAQEGPGGAHHVRDNGTSFVVTNGTLVYRATGTRGHTILRGEAIPGSKGDYRITTKGRILHNEDWFAFTFKVRHPGRAHVVRAWIPNDVERFVPLYAIDRPTGNYSGWVLQAGGDVPAAGPESPLTFMVWPNADAIDLMTFNATYTHAQDKQGAIVRAELFECPEGGLAALPEPPCGWQPGRELYWSGEQMDLGVNERTMPPLKGFLKNWILPEEAYGHGYHSWGDFLASWTRLGNLSAAIGNNFHEASISTYAMRCYRGRAERLAISGCDPYANSIYAEDVDPFDRDVFALMLMVARKYNMRIACDFMMDWITPEVAATWAKSYGMDPTGVTMTVDASGRPAYAFGGAAVNPVHPAVRRRMVEFCEAIGGRYGRYPAFAGMRHRFWPCCDPNFEPWFLKEANGYDDWTVGVFAREKGLDIKPVGTDQRAWDARRAKLTGEYGKAWFAWRTEKCLTLQREMLAALRKGAPNAVFFVNDSSVGTPHSPWKAEKGLDFETFRKLPELGYQEGQIHLNGPGCEYNNLDGFCFANFNIRPAPYQNRDHGTNHWRTGSYPDGLCCNSSYRSHPYQLEQPAKALAENRLTRICAGGEWCLPPPDAGLAAFVRIWRAIPTLDYARYPVDGGTNAAVAVWSAQTDEGLVFWAVNRTDRRLKVDLALDSRSMTVENRITGEKKRMAKSVTFELEPFMPALWRVSGENRIVGVTMRNASAADGDWTDRLEIPVCREPSPIDYYRRMQNGLFGNVEALRTKKGMQLTLFTPYEEFTLERRRMHPSRPEVTAPITHLKQGVPLKARFAGPREARQLTVTALFGGGYGSIRVEQEGKVLGVIPGSAVKVPRVETRVFPVPIAALEGMTSGTRVDLIGEGPEGLGVVTIKLESLNLHDQSTRRNK